MLLPYKTPYNIGDVDLPLLCSELLLFNGKKYVVKGVQNKSNYIKLEKLNKPVKASLVKPYEFRKGFCVV